MTRAGVGGFRRRSFGTSCSGSGHARISRTFQSCFRAVALIQCVGQPFIGARLVPLASSFAFLPDPVGGEPGIAIETDIFAFGPVEPWNVFPFGARGGSSHRSGLSNFSGVGAAGRAS